MTDAEKQEIVDLCKTFAMRLGEHCDSVTILVMAKNGDTTWSCKQGNGNYYARLAMAREFVNEDQSKTHHEMRPTPPADGDESWKG